MRITITQVAVLLAALPLAAVANGQENTAKPDPAGSWRWENEHTGQTDTLRFLKKADAWQGKYQAGDAAEVAIQDIQLDGDKVTFVLEFDHEGNRVTIAAKCRLQGDRMQAEATYKVASGETGEVQWTAKRTVIDKDVVGQWRLQFTDPNGTEHSPTITIKSVNDRLQAQVEKTDVASCEVANNELTLKYETTYEGNGLKLTIIGRPRANRMQGVIQYDLLGDTGEMNFVGVRE